MPIDREKTLQSAQKYVDRKKYDRAIAEYQRIVQDDPTDARTLLKIGDLQARLQAYPDAIATYDRVGQYYATQGFALKAIAVYKQIRELIRKHAPQLADRYGHILPKLAEIYTQLGLTSDALAAYDEVAARFQRNGRDREASDVFRKMIEMDAGNPLPHLRFAEACCRLQKLDDAINSFWTAAELLLSLDRAEDALKVIERILHFRPEPRFARAAAELYLRRGQREDGLQALAKLQVCFQADPKNLDTLTLLAQAFNVIGQEGKAIEVYKEMARIAREQGRRELFEQLLAHLFSIAPHDEQVRALQSLKPPPFESARPSQAPVSVGDDEVEFMDEEARSSVPGEAPFELRAREAARVHEVRGSEHHQLREARPLLASAPDVVVVDDDLEAAEEHAGEEEFDVRAHARKAVIDAESFRKLRLYSKAIEALHIALEIDPNSLEIRTKLRELLLESGARGESLSEGVTMALIHIERAEPELAEALLYEVLELDPEHADALQLLDQLSQRAVPRSSDRARADASSGVLDSFAPGAPLPAYDLDENTTNQVFMGPGGPDELDVIDDPFAPAPAARKERGPLPSFPLTPETDDLMAGLDTQQVELRKVQPPPAPGVPSFAGFNAPAIEPEKPGLPPENKTEQLEEAIDEASFFMSRGLYDDARAILNEQLARTPGNPLVMEHLHEIDATLLRSGASQTVERSAIGASARPPTEDDRAFDIAASLDALDALEQVTPSKTAGKPGFASMHQEVDVDQVFAKFKEGVRAQVSDSDTATHYDLGVAYKEMGLLNDAIGEFEIASKDPNRECMCFAMIGMIELEKGALDNAADGYIRALNAVHKTVEQEMALYYDLGNVYEMKKLPEDALYYFRKIARRDPGYRDVKDRISALQPPAQSVKPQSRAVNDDEEFDRVFDELFDSK
ncbi:MAG TPA: tetratricopeptide repeat protein [Polyangiaceae bacterium]